MSEVTLAPFQAHDEEGLEQLLEAAELPTEDLTGEVLEDFLIARASHDVVGAAGIEHYDDVALLRSVVVREDMRGTGLGKRLVEAMEEGARQAGVRELYLLTTTAADFFARLGYQPVAREAAPAGIQGTRQFGDLCPSSSAFMKKDLR